LLSVYALVPVVRADAACEVPNVVRLDAVCSAVLVHPRVLVYSAHCGTELGYASAGGERLALERCQSYPDGGLFGNDLAFCVLREAVLGVAIVAPALGCEVQAVAPGRSGWLVGFGGEGGQHIRRGQLQAVSEEISVAGPGFAACPGDSGGPLLVEVDDGLRVAGVLSASSEEQCVEGTAFFTPLWPFIPWLEEQSGFDLSPCGGTDGSWHPSADCQSSSAALLDCDTAHARYPSSTCGAAAAQDASPSYVTKQQNSTSCQSVSGRPPAITPRALGLTLSVLCAFVARSRRRFRDGAMDKRAQIM